MSMYRYSAYNAAGEVIQGAIEAESVIVAENRLRASGIWLFEAHEGTAIATAGTHNLTVKRGELINFFVQMTLLLRAGIPIPNAIDRLSTDADGTQLGAVLATVREQLTLGVQLHQTLAQFPHSFPPQVVAIVHAGEVSGHLPEAFEGLSSYYEWLDRLVSEIRQALIYPLMVTGAAFALVLLLFTFIVPRFVSLLTDLSLGVPLVTRITIAISNLLLHGWPFLIGGGFAAWFGLKMLLRSPRYACLIDRALMNLPVFGSLIAMFALSRFTQNLAMLYRSGIPLLRGLEICRKLVGNRAIEQAIEEVRTAVTEGTLFSKALAKHDVFPPTVVTMISLNVNPRLFNLSLNMI